MNIITEEVIVENFLGIHARPAMKLAQALAPFKSDVYIALNDNQVNAKSVMGLLTLGAAQFSHLEVICQGPDAEAAMEALKAVFASKFDDD